MASRWHGMKYPVLGDLIPACRLGIGPTMAELSSQVFSVRMLFSCLSPRPPGAPYQPLNTYHTFYHPLLLSFCNTGSSLQTEMDDLVISVFLAPSKCSIKACWTELKWNDRSNKWHQTSTDRTRRNDLWKKASSQVIFTYPETGRLPRKL